MTRYLPLLIAAALPAGAQSFEQLVLPMPAEPGRTIAVGFLGGLERWDDSNRSVRKLALRLREQGIEAETFANRRFGLAKKAILKALDTDRNGRVDPTEAERSRIIVYGQSLGGSSALRLARFLQGKQIPVLLTVQVDSVGLRDARVPPNVRRAANFYQCERLTIRGEKEIRATDPTRTSILGNFKYEYPIWHPIAQPETWPRRILGGGHARMEADPLLWSRIEAMILAAAHSTK